MGVFVMEITQQISLMPQTSQTALNEALKKWADYWLSICDEIEAKRLYSDQSLNCDEN
jgi:hypothetical protein